MKKLKYLVLTLLLIVAVGCGASANPEEVLKQASENMKKLDSYHMDMKMDMKMEYEGTKIEMSAKVSSDLDVKNGVGVLETTSSFLGMSSTEKSYFVTKDGVTTTYMEEDGKWYKETEEDVSSNLDFDIFSEASSIEKVKGEKNTYKIVLSEEQVKKLLDSTDEDVSSMDFDDIDIKITVNNEKITKMVMTMGVEGSEIVFTFEFSKFNEVSATIPEDVVNNAVDYDDYYFEDDYDYDL